MENEGFYNYAVEEIRSTEFPALRDTTYVDHAGATLYSRSQMKAVQEDMCSNVYGNPHSGSASSKLTTDSVDHVRYRMVSQRIGKPFALHHIDRALCRRVIPDRCLKAYTQFLCDGEVMKILKFFITRPEDYSVIFTSGCTGALKLLAESFSYSKVPPDTDILPQAQTDSKDGKATAITKPGNGSEKKATPSKPPNFVPLATSSSSTPSSPTPGVFCYLQDNHTSAQGMREAAAEKQQLVLCVNGEEVQQGLSEDSVVSGGPLDQLAGSMEGNCLFVFPAQSNFSGRKYPLRWVSEAQEGRLGFQHGLPPGGRWMVALDAASLVSTSPLDLSTVRPDFVSLSFYKVFGFPTGLGALLVRNESSWVLERRGYFGGGTVAASTARERFCALKGNLSDRFEDGTLPYLDIIALRHGFNALDKLAGGMEKISSHTFLIAQYLAQNLIRLRHANGSALAEVYCTNGFEDRNTQGAIVNFSLKRANGDYIGFAEVDKLAQLHDIHLRTGCFCNIGACQMYLGIASQTIKDNLDAGHVCGDDKDLINGRPTGSVRISFGYMSSIADAACCLDFIVQCFLEVDAADKPIFTVPEWFQPPRGVDVSSAPGRKIHVPAREGKGDGHATKGDDLTATGEKNQGKRTDVASCDRERTEEKEGSEEGVKEEGGPEEVKCSEKQRKLTDIFLYPIKSCGAFSVEEWELGDRGLLYDRTWMIVTENGVALGQKREPRLCLLKPVVHLESGMLELTFPDTAPYHVPLDMSEGEDISDVSVCTNKICNDRVNSVDCGDGVAQWLCETLERPGLRLLRQLNQDSRQIRRKDLGNDQTSAETRTAEKGSRNLSLANESQYLVICRESVRSLQKKLAEAAEDSQAEAKDHDDDGDDMSTPEVIDEDNLVERFRANLVIDGGLAFEEDSWMGLHSSGISFVGQGQCSRCGMIGLDQNTGRRSREPLRTLAAWRGGKVYFGVYMRREKWRVRPVLKVGSAVTVW